VGSPDFVFSNRSELLRLAWENTVNFIGGYADAWWKLRDKIDGSLRSASRTLDTDGHYSLRLGSPVLIGRADIDVMRVPIILAGGARERPVAYLVIEDTKVDGGRIKRLSSDSERLARAAIAGTKSTPGKDLELTYP
jgi:hypothetical protein